MYRDVNEFRHRRHVVVLAVEILEDEATPPVGKHRKQAANPDNSSQTSEAIQP